jgi:hypothetical protein
MDLRPARRLAGEWRNLLSDEHHPWADDQQTGQHRDTAWEALLGLLQEAVPDPDAATVYRSGGNVPMVAVLAGDALYLATVPGFDGARALAECRLVKLDPLQCSVTVTTQRWSDRFAVAVGSDWRFKIGDVETIELRTSTSSDDELSEDERFARELARALGWKRPDAVPAT